MDFSELNKMVETGKVKIVKTLVTEALENGVAPKEILEQGLLPGMNVIGDKFKNNEVYVPEVLIAARAMKAGMELLSPALKGANFQPKGKAVIGTIKGDLHDIGKNLVGIMLEGKGIEVIDLGVDVAPEKFVDEAIAQGATIIGASALLTTTMTNMKDIVEYAKEKGVRDQLTIMVGGAPITDAFCEKIGADIYTPDASQASDAALKVFEA